MSEPGLDCAPMNDHSPISGGLPPLLMYVFMRCRMVTLAKVTKFDTFTKFGGLKLLNGASYLRKPRPA